MQTDVRLIGRVRIRPHVVVGNEILNTWQHPSDPSLLLGGSVLDGLAFGPALEGEEDLTRREPIDEGEDRGQIRPRDESFSVCLRTHLETPVGCDILFLGNNQEQESCDFVN